ncbi:LamG domain-containing protein [Mycolicibacterium smegmatis]|nr:LamG domain-containing protein [Mycolicibacterium smegmatis]
MSMPIVGYTDRLTVEPGQTVEFKISSVEPTFHATLVRLLHGDDNPAGPGFKATRVPSAIEGPHPGRYQSLRPGSYVHIPHRAGLTPSASFSIHLWMWINSATGGRQTLLSQGSVDDGGYALRMEDSRITARVGDQAVTVASPILPRRWYSVAAVFDTAAGELRLDVVPLAINRAPITTARAVRSVCPHPVWLTSSSVPRSSATGRSETSVTARSIPPASIRRRSTMPSWNRSGRTPPTRLRLLPWPHGISPPTSAIGR